MYILLNEPSWELENHSSTVVHGGAGYGLVKLAVYFFSLRGVFVCSCWQTLIAAATSVRTVDLSLSLSLFARSLISLGPSVAR